MSVDYFNISQKVMANLYVMLKFIMDITAFLIWLNPQII